MSDIRKITQRSLLSSFSSVQWIGKASAFTALALALLAPAARACGPDFPNAYLAEGSVSLLNAPEGYFTAEIAKIASAQKYPNHNITDAANEALIIAANAAKRKNELTETGILRLELAKRGVAPARIEALAAELETVRNSIFAKAWDKLPAFSDDMPAEFSLYLNGAFAYWKNDYSGAREYWTKLLALPENDRRHYTVNATYMIGRTYVPGDHHCRDDDSSEGATWLRKTRDAAAAGFEDISGLADASLGWEARAWLDSGDRAKAIHLYMQQYAAGDYTSAINSLRTVASTALESTAWDSHTRKANPETIQSLQTLAQDELARRVVTVYLLARFGSGYWNSNDADKRIERQSRAWADALEKADLHDIPDTDRLAWIAYQAGYFDMAKKWADLATQDSVPANWIRAKLALRNGDLANGETLLAKVTASDDLTGEARPVAWSELGRIRMSRSEYIPALDAFVHGGHWEDSAYIAERVLTLDELRDYVDKNCRKYATKPEPEPDRYFFQSEISTRNSLRHLLARRLARANQTDDAVKYFPKEFRKTYSTYVADVQTGFDATLSAKKRAHAFWRAAQTIRENGMELLGTELAPDYFIWEGSFETGDLAETRQGKLRLETGPATPTADELKRIETTAVPEKRYHYRYRAAELGMWAASLLPNDNDETAYILNRSGTWLKNRDPKAANAFYRALVIRCPNTNLGKAAAKKGWFPDIEQKFVNCDQ